MNRVFFLTIAAVCSANFAYSQDKVLSVDKTTAATGFIMVSDSTTGKGTCILDMKRNTAPGANTGNLLLKTDSTLPQKLYNNKKTNSTAVKEGN